jgi:hypothetical protein
MGNWLHMSYSLKAVARKIWHADKASNFLLTVSVCLCSRRKWNVLFEIYFLTLAYRFKIYVSVLEVLSLSSL